MGGVSATLGSALFQGVPFLGSVESNLINRLLKKSTCVLLLTAAAQFSTATIQAVTIETVPVGDPGNLADTRYIASGVGSVGYDYRIGKYEVTNAQYVEFLNAVAASDPYGLYNPEMSSDTRGGIIRSGSPDAYTYVVKPAAVGQGSEGSDYAYETKPVVFVSLFSSTRFTNWLHNGQDNSDTENGAYQLLGGTPLPSNWYSITRSSDARWFLPSEDEWYKAAYYDPDSGDYYDYPTGTSNAPDNNLPLSDTGNSANFKGDSYATGSYDFPMTDAGAYAHTLSRYGTLDQAGNVAEWNDTLFPGGLGAISRPRGGYWGAGVSSLMSSDSFFENPDRRPGWNGQGFRVATVVPEPSGILLCLMGLLVVFLRPRRLTTP
jgi:formylglycine-generating enzyme required for sulfatase activity